MDNREKIEDLEQAALIYLGVPDPKKWGGMYCTLNFRYRHGVFGLYEREHSGYDGASHCCIKKMSLEDAWEAHLKHPIVRFAHDDTATGASLAIIGAVMIALNLDISKYAFVLFLLGGPLMSVVLLRNKLWWLLGLQGVYFATNILGVIRWF